MLIYPSKNTEIEDILASIDQEAAKEELLKTFQEIPDDFIKANGNDLFFISRDFSRPHSRRTYC